MIPANSPNLKSWVDVPAGSDFPIQNLPFGIFSANDGNKRVATAIGNKVVDLAALASHGLMDGTVNDTTVFEADTLNAFMAYGKEGTRAVRQRLSDLLNAENGTLRDNAAAVADALHDMDAVALHLPVSIGDYTDFYSIR